MKRPHNEDNQQAFSDLEQRLAAFKEGLTPSPFFLGQTKAELFQKIAADGTQTLRRPAFPSLRRLAGIVTSAAVLASVLFSSQVFSPRVTLASVGNFGEIHGEVLVRRGDQVVRVAPHDPVFEGDMIEVSSGSGASLTLAGHTTAELKQNTKIRVGSVMTMQLDNAVVTSSVHLSLTEGTFVQKKSVSAPSSSALITLATPSGTIKASPSADFTVTADTSESVALDVRSSGVTVISNTPETQDSALATVVREGESVILNTSKESGEVIIAAATVPPQDVAITQTTAAASNTNTNTSTSTPTASRPVTASSMEQPAVISFVELPATLVPDGRLQELLTTLQPKLEIAEVKMDQVVAHYTQGETDKALMALSGYISTVRGLAQEVGTPTPSDRPTTLGAPLSMDLAVRQSPLATAYGELAKLEDVDKSSEEYRRVMATLELLSKAEAALRMDTAEAPQIAMAAPDMSTRNAQGATESTAPQTTRTYIKKVQTGIIGEVEALLQDPDNKSSTSRFIALLARIPDEQRSVALLERIQAMVPGALKGFVAVKIHRISFPEAAK